MSKPTKPHVYVVLVDGVIRYIGKGRRGRKDQHVKLANDINIRRSRGDQVRGTRFYNKLAKAIRDGASIQNKVLKYFQADEQAFSFEEKRISWYKLHKPDQLWNLYSGGQGCSSEDAVRFNNDPEYKVKHLEGVRRAICNPEKEARRIEATKRSHLDPKIKARRRWAIVKSNKSRVGEKRSFEIRQKMRLTNKPPSRKGQTMPASSKIAIGLFFSNSIWINNGFESKRIPGNLSIPEGWVRGRAVL